MLRHRAVRAPAIAGRGNFDGNTGYAVWVARGDEVVSPFQAAINAGLESVQGRTAPAHLSRHQGVVNFVAQAHAFV